MRQIEIGSPILRDQELSYQEFSYPVVSRQFLSKPLIKNSSPVLDVVGGRRSRRTFKPLTSEQLNALLWHSSRTINLSPPVLKVRWEHRPAPSAGGRHPIDVLIVQRERGEDKLFLYQSIPHALATLKADQENIDGLVLAAERVLPRQEATVLWFGAQFERTLSRYENGDSLVWKDAGALTATFAFVAEALNLNFCPIGVTGEPYLSQCLETIKVTGVGGAYIGGR
jgi:SagB-type dehydrogenase family enzyme